MLACVVRLLALSLVAAAIAVPAVSAHPARRPAGSSLARSIVAQINSIRSQRGLRPLRLVRQLRTAADQHSSEMGRRGYFSHDSADGTSFWKRVEGFYGSRGYRYWSVGENLLWVSGTITPAEAVTMWLNSPPHRENLLEKNWRQIGLSVQQFSSAPGVYHGLPVTIVTADFGARH
jgi:uncharacterized protein YkwD